MFGKNRDPPFCRLKPTCIYLTRMHNSEPVESIQIGSCPKNSQRFWFQKKDNPPVFFSKIPNSTIWKLGHVPLFFDELNSVDLKKNLGNRSQEFWEASGTWLELVEGQKKLMVLPTKLERWYPWNWHLSSKILWAMFWYFPFCPYFLPWNCTIVHWIYPRPSSSHHQDFHVFDGIPKEPSFACKLCSWWSTHQESILSEWLFHR